MPSIFTKIIQGEVSCYKIFEDDLSFAFLDIRPHNLGHTLLVPKEEIADFQDLPKDLRNRLFKNSQIISKAIQKATKAKRIALMIHGLGVPEHCHIHLVPVFHYRDTDQAKAHEEPKEKMQEIAEKINSFLT